MKRLLLPLSCVALGALLAGLVCRYHYGGQLRRAQQAKLILISKQEMKLRVIDYKGTELFTAGIACGLNYGDKQKPGDMKTPEGVFTVSDIHDSRSWTHDFRDGKGEIKGAYGPHFIRLDVPGHKGIGIHGTHDSLSIGTRATEGCVRLKNEDLEKLIPLVEVPMTVVITPSVEDVRKN